MIVWLFFQRDSDDLDVISAELVKMVALTVLVCVGFSIWTQVLISKHPNETMGILLFTILAALGAAYGLSSFPRAAILPLAILGLPMAIRLLFMSNATTSGIGISLLLVILLLMRLLHTHSLALSELVTSRLAVAKEHNRAISAEVAALKRADQDALTGLANRAKIFREMQSHMSQGPSSGGGSVVAICDLDGFKAANDTFGHAAGDAILQAFATRLSEAFSDKAIVARTGGDEFAVFWRDGLAKQEIAEIGYKICAMASTPIEWEGKSLNIGASCGMTEAGPICSSVSEFLRQADSALYRAKASGRGVWRLYDRKMLALDKHRAALEKMLVDRKAQMEMTVQFQPIICLASGQVVCCEALARWNNEELGIIPPCDFISVAEQLGVIEGLNEVLLQKAITAVRPWPSELRLSFNLSAIQVSQEGSAARLLDLLEKSSFSPYSVQFEVTETAFLADTARARRELQKLKDAGCIIALDDFGAGYASVSYLRDLVFDVVKLDGSLTTDIQHCERSRRILLGLIELCHASGAKCVAEHVETKEQLSLIRAMGCDFAQGYHVGRPASGITIFGMAPDCTALPTRQAG
ncbi:EAL domain-containing protein [Erythrobacter sp. sf7]|uniref:EAL domain-containing protein n=1 Tax=Erythrobacter fulvus TaxID=2987523 RepID=A0ABT5JMS7_9SPHN|nr:EAL domain-containing protein [Erythrobacter fulvus]MDC8753939.1 EAL domain-containing protein [Erythrobacter fulvus]